MVRDAAGGAADHSRPGAARAEPGGLLGAGVWWLPAGASPQCSHAQHRLMETGTPGVCAVLLAVACFIAGVQRCSEDGVSGGIGVAGAGSGARGQC